MVHVVRAAHFAIVLFEKAWSSQITCTVRYLWDGMGNGLCMPLCRAG